MTTQIYATQVTQYFLNAVAAFEAGGAALNIAGGTLVVGDGNGSVPALSTLIADNGVTHEVWRGQTISSVSIDGVTPNQLDIECVIPAAINGVEIGPFSVTEFAILDALGNCCVVGTTNLQKTVSAQGQTSDLAWIAAIVLSAAGAVTVTPPSAGFATMTQVIQGVNANLPSCVAPLTKTDTVNPVGWIDRIFGIVKASQPADATAASDAAAMGVGRAATAAEFAAGAPEVGGFSWPWPTLQQIFAALAALTTYVDGKTNLTHGDMSYSVAGIYSWTCPSGVFWLEECVVTGAGGGGGGGTSTQGGGNGAAGGTARGRVAVTPGTIYTIIVGAPGAGGAAGVNSGGSGALSSAFGLSATGGQGGQDAGTGAGGIGGVGSGGTDNFAGGCGSDGCSSGVNFGGLGGASYWGGGARASTVADAALQNGAAPGSGGGAGYDGNVPGGAGAPGKVYWRW